MGYSKSTAIAIKGNYPKGIDCPSDEKYKTNNNIYFPKPKVRSETEDGFINKLSMEKMQESEKMQNLKQDLKKV